MSDVGTALNQGGVKRWKSKLLALGVIPCTPRIRRSTTPHTTSPNSTSPNLRKGNPSDTFKGFLNQLTTSFITLSCYSKPKLFPVNEIKTLVSHVFIKYIFKQSQR